MVSPRPRTENAFVNDGRPLVAVVSHLNGDYLQRSIREACRLLGGREGVVEPGDRVMIRPNFNCSYSLPLSTDLGFLAAASEVLQDAGAQVSVGEMSGRADWPTEKVISNLGVMSVLHRYGVKFVSFRFDEWLPMQVDGKY